MNKIFENKKVGFVIQARLGSQRLPGKALLSFGNSTIIGHLINKLIESGIDKRLIYIATTTSHLDNVLTTYIKKFGIQIVRGDEDNVLNRFQEAAIKSGFKNIVRLTGDNPFLDLDMLFYCIKKHLSSNTKMTTTRIIRNKQVKRYVPKGFSVDIINSEALLSIDSNSCSNFEKEHVIPFFYENFSFQVIKDYILNEEDCSIDTIEDYVRLYKS